MGLELLTGRDSVQAQGLIHARLREAASLGADVVVVVPGFADVYRERVDLASGLPLGVDVTTSERLLVSLWRRFGDGRRPVSASLRTALVAHAWEDVAELTSVLDQSAGLVELAAQLAWRSAGMKRLHTGDPRLRAIDLWLERYETRLAQLGLIELGEAQKVLSSSLPLRGAVVAWKGFTNLSPTQLGIIAALADANEVMVHVPWELGFAPTEVIDQVVRELDEIASSHLRLEAPIARSELEHVERCLYAPSVPITATGAVVLSEGAGPEAEVELVVRAVRRALGDGFDPGAIAVVFRDVAARANALRAAFGAAGIPHTLDVEVPLSATPFGRVMRALARFFGSTGTSQELLEYLRSPFCAMPGADVERLDVQWRRSRENSIGRLLAAVAHQDPEVGRVLTLARRVLTSPITERGLEEWQNLATRMFSSRLSGVSIDSDSVRLDLAARRRVLEAVQDFALSGLVSTGSGLLANLWSSGVASGSAEQPGAVQITEVQRIRSRFFDVVVLGGLTAQEFSSERSEPLAATLLAQMGLPAGTEERLAERLLFYLVATRAHARLELVRQSTDGSGNALRPSVFWEEIRDLYRRAAEAAEDQDGGLPVRYRLSLSQLAEAAPDLTEGRRALRARAESGGLALPGLGRGALSDPAPLEPPDGVFSVTELETYLGCPYRWFFERAVRPRELDRVFDARSKGSYAHALLSEFYGLFLRRHSRVTPDSLGDALADLDAVICAMSSVPRWTLSGVQEELSAAQARTWVRAAIEQDAEILDGWAPVEHEWEFGTDPERPYLMGEVAVRGKVDRIDEGPAGVIVTDYKTATTVSGHASFQKSGSIQPVVYLLAAAEHLKAPPVAGLYRSLPTRTLRGFWDADRAAPDLSVGSSDCVDSERFSDLVREAKERVARAAAGIRAGEIAPAPSDIGSCQHCQARSFCGERLQ